MSGTINIDPVTPGTKFGMSPFWDFRTQSLYFVDSALSTVHCYKPECDSYTTATVGCGSEFPLGFIVPIEGQENTFVIGIKNDIACIQWDGTTCKTSDPQVIQNLEPNENNNNITAGKVDPKGRLWAGTGGQRCPPNGEKEPKWEEKQACLSMLKDCSTVSTLVDCVSVSGGLEWSCDKKKFFFSDIPKKTIDVYDYCHEAGKICNPKPLFNLAEKNMCGFFSGLAMDCSAKLYAANYYGCQVLVIDPSTCSIVTKIKIPAKEVTGLCWGGPDNDVLFVTTANTEHSPNYPCAGRVFKVCGIGEKGIPCRNIIF